MKKETEMRQVLRAIAIVTRNDPDERNRLPKSKVRGFFPRVNCVD
jgi:hypothetical protein